MAALASLWRGRLYGLEIIRFLENHSQLALAEGTIYPILSRLKDEGMLTSEWVEADAGHPRKYYSLTDAGRRRVRLMAEAWTSFAGGLSHLLEPVLLHPADQDLPAGAPTFHPTDQDLSAGAPTFHPTDQDLSAGAPTLNTKENLQ
jgi:PadR family transcriptional regulator PadR